MKRKTLTGVAAAVAALAAVYIGATAYTGHRVAAAYEARLDQAEKQMPFLRFVDRKVDRGLLSSTFNTGLRVGCLNAGAAKNGGPNAVPPFEIRFVDHVRHGPFPGFAGFGAATIDSQIVLPASAPEALRNYVAGLEPADIRTQVGYGGDYRTAVRLPAGEIAAGGGKLSWPETRLAGSGLVNGEANAVEATLPELVFQSDEPKGSRFRLTDLRMRSENHGSGSLWMRAGNGAVKIGSIELQTRLGERPLSLRLSKLDYTTEVANDKDLMSGSLAMRADAALSLGDEAKPLLFENIELKESFKRLHVPTIQKWFEGAMAELSNCETDAAPAAEQAERARQQAEQLLPLLAHDPDVAIEKFALTHEGRRGELSYSAGVHGFRLAEGEEFAAALPRLAQALTLRANARLPVAWVEKVGAFGAGSDQAQLRAVQTEAMLDHAIGQGFVVRDGDDLTTALVFERGTPTLNGKPLGPQAK